MSMYLWQNDERKDLFVMIENQLKRIAAFSEADTDNTFNIEVV